MTEIKSRVAEAAKRAKDEKRADFEEEAEDRYARIITSGETVPWAGMRNYLKAKIAGKSIFAPKSRKLAR